MFIYIYIYIKKEEEEEEKKSKEGNVFETVPFQSLLSLSLTHSHMGERKADNIVCASLEFPYFFPEKKIDERKRIFRENADSN